MERCKLVVEGAGAVGVAALLGGQVARRARGHDGRVLSGGNVDAGLLAVDRAPPRDRGGPPPGAAHARPRPPGQPRGGCSSCVAAHGREHRRRLARARGRRPARARDGGRARARDARARARRRGGRARCATRATTRASSASERFRRRSRARGSGPSEDTQPGRRAREDQVSRAQHRDLVRRRLVGAVAWGVIALVRGEQISAAWLIAAALGSYAIAYRFYARFIARTVLGVDRRRATPAERLENDVDFQPTDRRVLFGHHFAAIAGAGPLVGPVLAAQMGYLPGTIWIIVGVIFAGAVQDMVDPVLLDAPRRQEPRPDGARRDRPGRRRGRAGRRLLDHDHPARRAGAGGRQRAGAVAVGHVLDRDDDPDRVPDGLLPAGAAAGPRARDDGHRRRAAAARDRRRRLGAGVRRRARRLLHDGARRRSRGA